MFGNRQEWAIRICVTDADLVAIGRRNARETAGSVVVEEEEAASRTEETGWVEDMALGLTLTMFHLHLHLPILGTE